MLLNLRIFGHTLPCNKWLHGVFTLSLMNEPFSCRTVQNCCMEAQVIDHVMLLKTCIPLHCHHYTSMEFVSFLKFHLIMICFFLFMVQTVWCLVHRITSCFANTNVVHILYIHPYLADNIRYIWLVSLGQIFEYIIQLIICTLLLRFKLRV